MAKFCPECGFEQHNDNNRYCSNCGFDFSKLESNIKSQESDNSSVVVPISSDDGPVSKPKVSDSTTSTSAKSPAGSGAKNTIRSAGSSAKTAKPNKPKSTNNDFLSNLTFNKCFLAFALLLILLAIIGMLSQATQTEPYSDDGLTSFMERSSSYGLSDFIEDSNNNYYDGSDYDYLSYSGHDDSANFIEN